MTSSGSKTGSGNADGSTSTRPNGSSGTRISSGFSQSHAGPSGRVRVNDASPSALFQPMSRFAPESFTNREISWLDFNGRVLEEARDPSNPLLERVKFLAITASNLDEFFEVRVAGVGQAAAEDVDTVGPDGIGSRDLLSRICKTS